MWRRGALRLGSALRGAAPRVRAAHSGPPLNPLAEKLEGSGIREIMGMAWALECDGGGRVIHLEVGQPDFAAPAHAVEATAHAVRQAAFQKYIPNAGISELRQAVADTYTARGAPTAMEQIVVTPGSMFSMGTTLMATVGIGDEVLVPDPGYPNYNQAVSVIGAKPVPYPCRLSNGWLPDPDEVASLITPRTKLIMVVSPANPTGAVVPLDTLDALLRVARERNVWVLSDEIYSEINLADGATGPTPSAIDCASFDEDFTVVMSGMSKSHAMTGWRVGWMRTTPHVAAVAQKLLEAFVSCGVPFAQRGALAALQGPRSAVDDMVGAYRRRLHTAVDILAEHGLHEYTPGGAFYMLVRCGSGSSTDFAKRLLREHRVAVSPGSTFGTLCAEHVRISLASSEADVAEGVARLCRAIKAA